MKFSILDPLVIEQGSNSTQALKNAIKLAQYAESLDFARYWVVEHHAVHYEAAAAPEILVSAILNQTQKISVGVGGFLLNNYSPYKIAEIIKTLSALHPGRVDFGIGHSASGPLPDFALQANRSTATDYDHCQAVDELLHWLANDFVSDNPFSTIPIMADTPVAANIWSMAVSEKSAVYAAKRGMNLACSAFHEPEKAVNSMQAYQGHFQPSPSLTATHPTALLAIRLIVADTQEEAERMAMPMRHLFYQRRKMGLMPYTTPTIDEAIAHVGEVWPAETTDWPMYIIGDKERVYATLSRMREQTGVGEILIQDILPTFDMRTKMYAILAEIADRMA